VALSSFGVSAQEVRALQQSARLTEIASELLHELRSTASFDLLHVRVFETGGELAERAIDAPTAARVRFAETSREVRRDDRRIAHRARKLSVEHRKIQHVLTIEPLGMGLSVRFHCAQAAQ
jgi:hypothetical protein